MYRETKELYEFGSFRLDVNEHTLTQSDGSKDYILPEKAFLTLCVLVQRRGRLVTKKELLAEIWPDSFVEENNLDKCIHAVRQVLGEKPGEKKYIETVRKHGYRFVAAVNHLETPYKGVATVLDSEFLNEWGSEDNEKIAREIGNGRQNSTVDDPAPVLIPERTSRTSWRTRSTIVVAVLLLAAAIGSGYLLYPAKNTAADDKMEFAVLPVSPIDGANRSDLYEIGIADSLIQGLSSINGFVVRPLSATRKYTEIGQDPLAAGREQKVDYVLVSSYQIADGRIKITSQLLNVTSGNIEETNQSDNELKSVFAAQEAIAGSIRSKLMARFARTPVRSPAKRGTTNLEAYNYYLQGMVFYDKRNARKAIENLDKAIALDPDYARAWAGKARAHLTGTDNGPDIRSEYENSIAATNKALELDPDLSEAHCALCQNKYFYEYDFAGAERECKRALELDPNSGIAHAMYSGFLMSRGRQDEAFAEIGVARELDPTSYFWQRIYANELYFARRYDEAISQNKQMLEINPYDGTRYLNMVWNLEMLGRDSEAFEWFIKILTLRQRDAKTIQRYQAVYASSGWRGVLLEREKEPVQSNYYRRAGMNARLGNKDLAFKYLEQAYEDHSWLIPYLQIDPALDALRDDPRYLDLVRRIGL